MRTTLDIDDDILTVTKDIAKTSSLTTGRVVSDLLRKALTTHVTAGSIKNGVPLFDPVPGAKPVSLKEINELRDDLD